MTDWSINRPAGVCAITGKPLEEGEEFYSVLFEDGESFRRVDYSLDAWTGTPEGAFCCFRSRVAAREKRRKLLVDNDLLVNFFLRLAEETEERRIQFRFVLALILMRKRILKYEDSTCENDREVWTMRLVREASSHRVINPQLTDDQIVGVSEELSAIMHGDVASLIEQDEQRRLDAADRSPDSEPDETPAAAVESP